MHFIWALLLRIDKIANYSLRVNTESTELQKIICEMKNIAREWLKIELPVSLKKVFADDKLLQLQFLFHDLVQFNGTALSIVRVGVCDLQLMQLLAAPCNGRAHGSLRIVRLLRLRNKRPHEFA